MTRAFDGTDGDGEDAGHSDPLRDAPTRGGEAGGWGDDLRAPSRRPLPYPFDQALLPPQPPSPRYLLAFTLLALSFVTTTTLGAAWVLFTSTEIVTDLRPFLSPDTLLAVWRDPVLRHLGLSFSLPALGILLCHELGHYLACRWYGLPATLPYFLPAPVGLGTFGAFIRIRSPIRTKRQLFDVGVAGPLAGFVALLPFLLIGVARSAPVALGHGAPPGLGLLVPGKCLALELATRLFHGPLPAGTVLELHPFALAAWFGLLATSLNLLPLGQLDGGHILYAATGPLQRRIALPLWLALATAGLLWIGWLVWCAIILVIGMRHPPVQDEEEPLGAPRQILAVVAFALLALSFMPLPISEIPLP